MGMKLLVGSLLVLSATQPLSSAALAATATANASATIQAAISFTKDDENAIGTTSGDLAFGTIVPDESGGTVVIDPASGARSNGSGTLELVANDDSALTTYGPAAFIVSGSASTSYTITVPSEPISLTSGTDTMTVDEWTSSKSDGTTDTSGQDSFKIGGTLTVVPDQPAGTYVGSFVVTVDYN